MLIASASTIPLWLTEIVQGVVALAAAISAVAALIMAFVNLKKLRELKEGQKRIALHVGMREDEIHP